MRVFVDPAHCERSGECVTLVPQIFSVGPEGQTVVHDGEVPPGLEADVRSAVEFCPRIALTAAD